MAVTFPTSPTNGQTFTVNGLSYVYNATYGVWRLNVSAGGSSGGYDTTSPFKYNTIDYITIQTISDATDFGDLLEAKAETGSTSGSPS